MTSRKYSKFEYMTLLLNSNLIYPKVHCQHQFEEPHRDISLLRVVLSMDLRPVKSRSKFTCMTLLLNSKLVYHMYCWHQFEDPSWNTLLVTVVTSLDGLMSYNLQKIGQICRSIWPWFQIATWYIQRCIVDFEFVLSLSWPYTTVVCSPLPHIWGRRWPSPMLIW